MPLDPSSLIKSLAVAKGRGNELAALLESFLHQQTSHAKSTLEQVLPILFRYDGKPLTLNSHFCMEPLFNYDLPREITLMCSRQVGKTLQMAARALTRLAWLSHWDILFVAPFYETIRRVSTDYFASLIDQSPIRNLFTGPGCASQVLERVLPNRSRIRFTYAYRNADRARGIHARELYMDEYQLMLSEVVPVLTATMDASEYGDLIMRAGTPLTNSNHLTVEFKEKSSRSHWMIPCRSCGYESIAAIEYDIINMIGPIHDNIGPDHPAIICGKKSCGYPLFPQDGRFIHLNPHLRSEHLGLHIPSIIMPMHCFSGEKWKDLWKILTNNRLPTFTKYNECLGIPYDDGVTLLTQNDMERTACLNRNEMREVMGVLNRYSGRIVIGVDWGGGGMSGDSLTKVAVVGLNHDGCAHVIFGMMFSSTASKQEQAEVINYIWQITKATHICHDNLGIGSACEAMLVEKGVPHAALVPMEYVGETQKQIMALRKATQERPRPAISVDKTRGILHMIEAFKSGKILTFRSEEAYHASSLLSDLTHLRAENKVYVHSAKTETVLIGKEPGTSDDFAHAIHFACNWLWFSYQAWPQLTKQIIVNTPTDISEYLLSIAKVVDPATAQALGLRPVKAHEGLGI